MPHSNRNNPEDLAQDLASSLKSTTNLIHSLMDDIKDNAASFAVLKQKLESLSDSVELLSHIVREGNGKGSIVTRLALFEQSLDTIEERFKDFKEEVEESIKELRTVIASEKEYSKSSVDKEKEFRRQKMLEKLKLVAVVAPGLIALALVLIKLLAGVE